MAGPYIQELESEIEEEMEEEENEGEASEIEEETENRAVKLEKGCESDTKPTQSRRKAVGPGFGIEYLPSLLPT